MLKGGDGQWAPRMGGWGPKNGGGVPRKGGRGMQKEEIGHPERERWGTQKGEGGLSTDFNLMGWRIVTFFFGFYIFQPLEVNKFTLIINYLRCTEIVTLRLPLSSAKRLCSALHGVQKSGGNFLLGDSLGCDSKHRLCVRPVCPD